MAETTSKYVGHLRELRRKADARKPLYGAPDYWEWRKDVEEYHKASANALPALLDEFEQMRAESFQMSGFIQELISKCENPIIRVMHTQAQMCKFLDTVHNAAQNTLKGG